MVSQRIYINLFIEVDKDMPVHIIYFQIHSNKLTGTISLLVIL